MSADVMKQSRWKRWRLKSRGMRGRDEMGVNDGERKEMVKRVKG